MPSGTMAAVPGVRQYLTFRRLAHALSGWRGGVALVACILGAAALAFIPSDVGDQRLAQQMQERSERLAVDGVEVYVAKRWGGKGGPSWEVQEVRVRLAGRGAPVLLEGVVGNDLTAEWTRQGDPTEGWQAPTRATSYDQEPLPVRVLRLDGREHVMAQDDVDYWGVGNHDVRTDLVLGIGGLSCALSWAVGCIAVDENLRRRRRLARPPRPHRDGEGRHR